MGLTFNLGRLSPSLFTDSSLNVGIGAAPSGSYKLEVTGTAKVSSTLLLGGALSGTSATFSGLITVSGFGNSTFSSGGTGYNKLTIRNTTAGAANGSQLSVGTNADPDQFYVQSFATTFTTSGMNIAGGAVVNGEGPGGLSLAATQSNIGFYTNGAAAANLRMNIATDGLIQLYAGTNQAAGGAYNTFGNLYVASTSSQGTDIGGSISIGGKFNGAGAYATFARIQGKKENSSSGQTGGYLAFETNTDVTNNLTERMRITSVGNVGIDATTLYAKLHIGSASNNENNIFFTRNTTTANVIIGGLRASLGPYWGDATSTSLAEINLETDNPYYKGAISFRTNNSDATANRAVERMRITSGGNILMGLTTNPASARLALDAIGMAVYDGGNYRQCYMNGNTMYWYNGSNQGALTSAGVWQDASDISIKKDIEDIKYGLDAVLKLKPRSYKMKEDDLEQIGFIAQEVEEVIKELVTTDNKGMKGLSYGQLTAVLTKAIQEMNTKSEEQQATITSLNERLNKAGL